MTTYRSILLAAALGLAACTDTFVQTAHRDIGAASATLVVHVVEADGGG